MTRKLFLHIGSPKTGTTSLQNTLAANSDQLSLQNFSYPGPEKNHHFLYFKTGLPRSSWPRNFQSVSDAKLESVLAQYFPALESDIVNGKANQIMSSETLFRSDLGDISNIRKYLDSLFDEIRVIVYIRNPADAYGSAQQQRIRACSTIVPPTEYFYDFKRTIETWSKFSSVIVKQYLPSTDIVASFAEEVGIDLSGFSDPVRRVNQSLSMEQMLTFEKIQSLLYKNRENRIKPHLYQLGQIAVKDQTKPVLRPHAKQLVFERHQADLFWLAQNFGILFDRVDEGFCHKAKLNLERLTAPTVSDVFAVEKCNHALYEAKLIDRLCRLQAGN